ncbi:MAG: hypothetical protein R3F29_01535 [Planctomycetota bacterium]
MIAIVALWAAGLAMVERACRPGGGDVAFVFLQPSPLWLVVVWVALRSGATTATLVGLSVGAWHALGRSPVGPSVSLLTSAETWWSMVAFAGVAAGIAWGRARVPGGDVLQSGDAGRRASPDFVEGEQELIDRAVDRLSAECGAIRCSLLYLLPDGAIDFAVHRGWSETAAARRARTVADDALVAMAISKASLVVTPEVPTDLRDDEAGALMVAPVQQGDGVLRMLLCIDELPEDELDEQTVRRFQSIVDWLGARVRRGGSAADTVPDCRAVLRMLQASNAIGSAEGLSERIFLEDARSRRYGVSTSMIAVRVPALRERGAPPHLEEVVQRAFTDVVRQSDDAYRFGFVGFYVVVLVGCAPGFGETVCGRIAERLAEAGIDDCELVVFAPDEQSATLQGLLPRMTEFFLGDNGTGRTSPCPVPAPRAQVRGDLSAFLVRLRLELGLSRRLAADLNLIEFRARPGATGIAPMIARHLSNQVGRSLRPTDGIYVLSSERCVVMLPNTNCLDAIAVWRRIDDELADSLPAGYHELVESETISMTDVDVRHVILHVLGEPERAPDQSLLSDDELDHLAAQFAAADA